MNRRTASWLSLALLLVPVLAGAQTISIRTPTDAASTTYTFTKTSCTDTLTLQWIYAPGLGTINSGLKLWATDGDCGDTPAATDVRYDDVPLTTLLLNKTGNFSVSIAALPGFNGTSADGGTSTIVCGTADVTKTHKVCGAVNYTNSVYQSTTLVLDASPLSLVYDAKPPAAPTITLASGEDGTIKVTFTVDTDASTVALEVQGPTDAAFVSVAQVSSSATAISAKNFANGTTYGVRLRATDAAGNVSVPSLVSTVTVAPTIGFWELLRDGGVSEPGVGCSQVSASRSLPGDAWSPWLSALAPLAGLALLRAATRKRSP